ncbi:hypothetical protein FRB96_001782 [Tulasnella sp. 330]|nr:hypothetical protein FRB96_001782 [Tulasnella sp. 330]
MTALTYEIPTLSLWPSTEPSVVQLFKEGSTIVEEDIKAADRPAQDSREEHTVGRPRGVRFWLVMASLMMTAFLNALDTTAISIVGPTIVSELHGDTFIWAAVACSLTSTAVRPMCGNLAQIFGRGAVMTGALTFFGVGSVVSAVAKSMNMFTIGRALVGIGTGGVAVMTDIVVSDMVPLRSRGVYFGMIAGVWGGVSGFGPVVGGALSGRNWRWLFYVNLPITAIAMILLACFVGFAAPEDEFIHKLKRIDWIGNFLVVGSTISLVIGFTWAGVYHPWQSAHVVASLLLGFIGLVAFFSYEAGVAKYPIIPSELVGNRTSVMGSAVTCTHTVSTDYLPVYFQGAQMQKSVQAGISEFGIAFSIPPAAVLCGISVSKLNHYRPENLAAWIITAVGFGLNSIVKVSSPTSWQIGFQVVVGIGIGMLYSALSYPILAPISITKSAHSLSLLSFVRGLAGALGLSVGTTVLQNELKAKLPMAFLSEVSTKGVQIAYSIIPIVETLPEPLRFEVRNAFSESLQTLWKVMAGVAAVGALCVFAMKEIPMHEITDKDWALESVKGGAETDSEKISL